MERRLSVLFLMGILLIPIFSAGSNVVSSERKLNIGIDVDEEVMLEMYDLKEITAKITVSWDFVPLVPSTLTIGVEIIEAPSWLTVNVIPSSFDVSVVGADGKVEKYVTIELRAIELVEAFRPYTIKLHVHSSGGIGIEDSEAYKEITVKMDCRGDMTMKLLEFEYPGIRVKKGEIREINVLLTNYCNGDVRVYLELQGLSEKWEASYENNFTIPSEFSGNNEKIVKINLKALDATENWESVKLLAKYYPANAEGNYTEKTTMLLFNLKAYEKTPEITNPLIIAALIITISLIVVVVILRKVRGG